MSLLKYVCDDSTMVIVLEGDFDASRVSDIRDDLESMIGSYEGDVVVDMSSVKFIDSSGVGALVYIYKRMLNRRLRMAVLGVKGQPLKLISLLRIDRALPMFENINDYLRSSQQESV